MTPTPATTRIPDGNEVGASSPIGTRPLLRANMHPPSAPLKQSVLPFSLTSSKPKPTPAPSTTTIQHQHPLKLATPAQTQPQPGPDTVPSVGQAPNAPTSTQPNTLTTAIPTQSQPQPQPQPAPAPSTSAQPQPSPAEPAPSDPASSGPAPRRLGPGGVAILARATPYHVCAYCMGPATKNKFGRKEAMVSCYECGSSGHPSCCGFDDARMVRNVKSYNWCCGDCTRCEVCDVKGEDNDETVSWRT